MKRMIFVVAVVLGLPVCGFLVVRHQRRALATSPDVTRPATVTNPPGNPVRPMNTLQSGVKLETKTDYTADPEAKRRLMELLRREEQRQKPQEQRN